MPEIIVARHCSIRVLALSLVTNNAVLESVTRGDDTQLEHLTEEEMIKTIEKGRATHEEVLAVAANSADVLQVCLLAGVKIGVCLC